MQWQYRKLIAALGGGAAVAEKIRVYGFVPPSTSAIRGWSHRNAVPGAWVPVLLAVAIREDIIVNVDHFVRMSRKASK